MSNTTEWVSRTRSPLGDYLVLSLVDAEFAGINRVRANYL
jgi:hypothetical protein